MTYVVLKLDFIIHLKSEPQLDDSSVFSLVFKPGWVAGSLGIQGPAALAFLVESKASSRFNLIRNLGLVGLSNPGYSGFPMKVESHGGSRRRLIKLLGATMHVSGRWWKVRRFRRVHMPLATHTPSPFSISDCSPPGNVLASQAPLFPQETLVKWDGEPCEGNYQIQNPPIVVHCTNLMFYLTGN